METDAIISLAAIGIVVIFAALGAWRGLVKTVAGLLITILALLGAGYIASTFSGPLAQRLAPAVEERVSEQMREILDSQSLPDLSDAMGDLDSADFSGFGLENISSLLEHISLPDGIQERLRETLEDMRGKFSGSVSGALSAALVELLKPVCYGLLFFVSFTVLSFVLKLLMKLADPLVNLPVVRQINMAGGAIVGLVQGFVVVCVALWILEHFTSFETGGAAAVLSRITEQVMELLPFTE